MSSGSQTGGVEDRLAVVGGELGLRHHRLLARRLRRHRGDRRHRPRLRSSPPARDSPRTRPSRPSRAPRPRTTAASAASVTAAAPACRHIDGRSRVVTTGSGGRP